MKVRISQWLIKKEDNIDIIKLKQMIVKVIINKMIVII